MSPEAPLQYEMFTGAMVDNRTAAQKRVDRERAQPAQTEMFSQRDLAQFGVRARPLLPLSPHTKLVLISEDPRTPEQVERDLVKEAEANTLQLFADGSEHKAGEQGLRVRSRGIVGYRKQQRQQRVCYSKADVSGTGRETNTAKQVA